MPKRDDDLEWLYGRDRSTPEPERTRVMDRTVLEPPPNAAGQPPGTPPGPPPSARSQRPPQPPRRRHPVRTFFLVVVVLVVLALLWLIGVPAYAWSKVARLDADPGGERPANQPGQTFLLVGSDSREGLTKEEQKRLGTGSTAGRRTDTIMLVYVPVGGKPALISVPRDSFVPIPGKGRNKINAAYSFGGPELLVQTVESNTGLRVDSYVEIGFGGFVNIIDALGGIEMCLPKAIKDRDSHINLPKGCQNLDGTTALGYVRMRKADPRGDLGRVERQREMLAAVAKKAASPATVVNPVRYWTLSNASTQAVTLDQDTSLFGFSRLALAMRRVSNGNGFTLTVPIADNDASTSAGSAVLWDEDQAKALFSDLARGDTDDLQKYVSK
ncbi:MAG TPA: LCP family protein [Propionibacteriaceae bacterium]|jgi:LCP family protein required for cell wall assembly|nr:LCP family protein [Propionibacteriaceae bacterium]